jgi:hypothetical protein
MATLPGGQWHVVAFLCLLYAFIQVHAGIKFVPRIIERTCMTVAFAIAPSSLTTLGQPFQTLYPCVGLVVGETIGFVLVEQQWHEQELAHVERKAFRVLNHTSKRVAANTAQCLDICLEKLQRHATALGEDSEHIFQLLSSARAQNVCVCGSKGHTVRTNCALDVA